MKNQNQLLLGLGITGIGAYLIYYLYSIPCEFALEGISPELAQVSCLISDPKMIILMIVGTSMLLGGIKKVIENV